MAKVPSNIPPEPQQSRCGDSYKEIVYVDGTIPGTDPPFGGEFEHKLEPVKFTSESGSESVNVPRFPTDADKLQQIKRVEDRLWDIRNHIESNEWAYTLPESGTLDTMGRRGLDLINQAKSLGTKPTLPGGQVKVQELVTEALKHLRCVEYWAWRLQLYKQAVREYEPPFEPGITALPPADRPDLGEPPTLPPPDTFEPEEEEPEEEKPKKKPEEKKKVSPWLIAGGLALAGGVYYFFLRKK